MPRAAADLLRTPAGAPVERCVDVLVVGAGPAGCAAAVHATRAGLSTVVADRAVFPRDKTCGDGLTTGALRELDELGLDPVAVGSWTPVRDIRLAPPSDRVIHLQLPEGPGTYAAVARRRDLDAALVALAREAGATVLEGHALDDVVLDDDGVVARLATADGATSVRARYVVAADGVWSPTRRLLQLDEPGYRGEWHAFRQYVRGVSEEASRVLAVWFEPDILPGYVWSFPLAGGGANVGFGIRRGSGWQVRDMARLWPEILARPRIREVLGPEVVAEGPHRAWPIPARVDRVVLGAHRVLFVGDAAAATDGFTGEGIGQALLTGRWAAAAIRAGGPDRPDRVRAHHEAAVRQGLVADHRASELLSRALSHRKGVRISAGLAALTPWTRRNFARWLFEDYPRAVVATPRRWHRGMFTGPGAFRP